LYLAKNGLVKERFSMMLDQPNEMRTRFFMTPRHKACEKPLLLSMYFLYGQNLCIIFFRCFSHGS